MDTELLVIGVVMLVVGVVAVWRDPRAAGKIIGDILDQFKNRRDANERRDDNDSDGDQL